MLSCAAAHLHTANAHLTVHVCSIGFNTHVAVSQLHPLPELGPDREGVQAKPCPCMPYHQMYWGPCCPICIVWDAFSLEDGACSLVAVMVTMPCHVHLKTKTV